MMNTNGITTWSGALAASPWRLFAPILLENECSLNLRNRIRLPYPGPVAGNVDRRMGSETAVSNTPGTARLNVCEAIPVEDMTAKKADQGSLRGNGRGATPRVISGGLNNLAVAGQLLTVAPAIAEPFGWVLAGAPATARITLPRRGGCVTGRRTAQMNTE